METNEMKYCMVMKKIFCTGPPKAAKAGQKDTVPQFENFLTFGAAPKVNINIQKIAQNLHPILPTQNQNPIHLVTQSL